MSDSYIQLPADGEGKKTRTNLLGDVHQQIVQLADATGTEIDFSTLATADKQLPDNHNVTVSNQVNISLLATIAKQDALLTKMNDILTELTKKTNSTDDQLVELTNAIRVLLQAVCDPAWLDKSANQIRSQVTGTATVTFATNQDIRTLTNCSTIDNVQGRLLALGADMDAWANTVRSRIG